MDNRLMLHNQSCRPIYLPIGIWIFNSLSLAPRKWTEAILWMLYKNEFSNASLVIEYSLIILSVLSMEHSEQVLHLWLETLCSCVEVVEKWYQPWSFMRSPGWVQIKCELRLVMCELVVSVVQCYFSVFML